MKNTGKEKESVQDTFLQNVIAEGTTVYLFLVSGIKLVGKIVNYDQYSIELTNEVSQVVLKSAISTVLPAPKG